MKTRKPQNLTFHIQKVCCALLASCTLLSSCQKNAQVSSQDLMQNAEKLTVTPQETLSPAPTPTSTPEPTPTTVPIPTPSLVPTPTTEPTPVPDFAFLPQPDEPNKTSLLDYMSQEEIDAILPLSYDPDSPMQLYARYQGVLQLQFTHHNYCIDLVQLDDSIGDILINIKIFSGSPRFLKYGDSTLLQNIYYYVDSPIEPEVSKEVLQIMDLNNDGYDDFIFDLGIAGIRNKYSIAFVYDVENAAYVLLGDFYTAKYIPEKQTICEESYSPAGFHSQKYKYLVVGTEAILTEFIDYLDDSYTYQKLMDGELVTILKDVTYKELCEMIIDFETWRTIPACLE